MEQVVLPQCTRAFGESGPLLAVASDLDRLAVAVDAWMSRDGAPTTLAGADAAYALHRAVVIVRELLAVEAGQTSAAEMRG